MTLRIDRVQITNYRNFLKFDIANLPPTIVLVGENEAGKSNFIRALRLVLDPDLSSTDRELEERDMCDFAEKGFAGGETIQISVDLVGFDDNETVKAILGDYCTELSPCRARITYLYAPSADREVSAPGTEPDGDDLSDSDAEGNKSEALKPADYRWTLYGADDPTRNVNMSDLQRIAIQLVGALRDAENELLIGRRRNPLRQLLAGLTPEPGRLATTSKMLNDASDYLMGDASVSAAEKAIAEEINKLTGSALSLDPTLGVSAADPERLLRQARLFLDRKRTRSVGDVSLGVANIVFLSLLFRAIEARRQQQARAAVMLAIEEPEAHLHVQIQRRLFRTLLAEEEGVIVTTHSPHLASVSPVDRVILLRRQAGSGTIARSARAVGLTAQQTADIERYLTVTRAELLFARYALLVEGDAELYVVPALAKSFGVDLDEYGISVVSVQGTDFAPYWRILSGSGFDIPSVMVTDGDHDLTGIDPTSPGVARGIELDGSDLGEPLRKFLDSQLGKKEKVPAENHAKLVRHLRDQGIFVGRHTLEIDLARSTSEEFLAASKELLGAQAAKNVEADLAVLAEGSDSEEVRNRVLNRVEKIGKGRFAQRWADHLTGPLVAANLARKYESSGRDWLAVPGGHVLGAIDAAVQAVGGRSLIEFIEDDSSDG